MVQAAPLCVHRVGWPSPRLGHGPARPGAARRGPARPGATRRDPARPGATSFESVAATGFYGLFWQPPAGQDNHIAILEFLGYSGGIDTSLGALFASRGYPTLDIAYDNAPGLPQTAGNGPNDIPLEYFAKALSWLGRQPGVDPKRIWLMGWSFGGQGALLVGVHYPKAVHGVVALMPSDTAICPAWTFSGQPVRCTNEFDNPHPTDNPAAVIPVAEIRGPVLFTCGGHDTTWPSCPFTEAMMSELAAAHDTYPHMLLDYANAGHGVGLVAPYSPGLAPDEVQSQGVPWARVPSRVPEGIARWRTRSLAPTCGPSSSPFFATELG